MALEQAGHVLASEALTPAEAAAYELRTISQPRGALDAVLGDGCADCPVKFIFPTSLLLEDCVRGEDGGDSGRLGAVKATSGAPQTCSPPRLVQAVQAWAQGGKLFDVVGLGVPAGHICRRVLRLSECSGRWAWASRPCST